MEKKERQIALSVRQPYAESILRGEKIAEFRTKNTEIRGRVWIYASKGREKDAIFTAYGISKEEVAFGKIIGSVEITSSEVSIDYPEWYEWTLANPIKFDQPLTPKNQPLPIFWYPEVEDSEENK